MATGTTDTMIAVRSARVHNLLDVDVDLPRDTFEHGAVHPHAVGR